MKIARPFVLTMALLLSACGGGSSHLPLGEGQGEGVFTSASPSPQPSPKGEGDLDSRVKFWEPMIRSSEFTGQLAVMFTENAGVRFGAGVNTFRSKFNTNLKTLNDLMAQHPEASVRLGLPDIDQEFLDQRIAEIRAIDGYPMTDWASFYIIDVMDADEAIEILSALVQSDYLWFAHPIPRAYPTGIQIPNITPGPGQDYLNDLNSTGGLNVKAAWDAGLDGTGIVLRDEELNWNVNHLDLPLSDQSFVTKYTGSNYDYLKQINSSASIQHGAATAGIIVAKNNGIGVTGISPNASLQLAQHDGAKGVLTGLGFLVKNQATYADGTADTYYMKPGDIYVVEFAVPTKPGGCDIPSGGFLTPTCVPDETYYANFIAYKDLINYGGIVVVEGAGNSAMNLDNVVFNDNTGIVNFATDSSGAIMVGASMGGSTLLNGKHTLEKAPYSNCGSRVDVFAWGTGVVTTGYGDHPISVTQTASTPGAMKVDPALLNGATKYVDPNQAYTASFAGTSSATAIIAGSAALLQQYAKQLYTDPKGACAIKSWEYIYLSSQQMRDVMVKSGTASKPYKADAQMWSGYADPNPGCTIGTQPDLAKAMQIIKDGCDGKTTGVKATVKTKDLTSYCPKATLQNPTPKKQSWCPDYGAIQPAIAKMMDLDGDGRADLISFSKDRKWTVDLSSVGPTQFSGVPFPAGQAKDNFGTWNLTFDLSKDTSIAKDAMLFPVVMDYNTDGKADLALYDSVHGKWVVTFTTGNLLNTNNAVNGVNPWPGWDMVIDYSTQPHWKPYSRPVPGDYDGQDNDPYTYDHYMDLALQTPDGWWLIDFGGANPKANYGSFDKTNNYLTTNQVNEAPGWAWLPSVYLTSYDNSVFQSTTAIAVKAPDDINDATMVNKYLNWDDANNKLLDFQKTIYGSNADVFTEGKFQTKSFSDLGFKKLYPTFGLWQVATVQSGYDDLINIDPYVDFGGINCRVIPGDYDGDGYDDRAVQCGNTWKIAYTGSKYPINSNKQSIITLDGKQITVSETFRIVNQQTIADPLPGYVYPGGVSFKDVKEIFATVNNLCPTVAPTGNTPPCSLLTMIPTPIGPYFPQCVDAVKKSYATDPCSDPKKQVSCETMHIQQAQCVYQ